MRWLIFFSCLLIVGKSLSQEFEVLDLSDKLSQNNVNCMIQDEAGFVWLGTNDGLNRFDGTHMTEFRYARNDSNCICGNKVLDLTEDDEENIWIATSSCLNKLNLADYSFSHYINKVDDPYSISNNSVSLLTS